MNWFRNEKADETNEEEATIEIDGSVDKLKDFVISRTAELEQRVSIVEQELEIIRRGK